MRTPKKRKVDKSSSEVKINIGLLKRLQLTKAPFQKAEVEDHEIIEHLIIIKMCGAWNKELVFNSNHFWPDLILVDCATNDGLN